MMSRVAALGDADDQIVPVLAGAALALAVRAVFRRIFALVAKVHQGGHMGVGAEDNIPSPAAVPAVGAAGGHVLLPVEGHTAVPAVPRADSDFRGVYKLIGHRAGPSLVI